MIPVEGVLVLEEAGWECLRLLWSSKLRLARLWWTEAIVHEGSNIIRLLRTSYIVPVYLLRYGGCLGLLLLHQVKQEFAIFVRRIKLSFLLLALSWRSCSLMVLWRRCRMEARVMDLALIFNPVGPGVMVMMFVIVQFRWITRWKETRVGLALRSGPCHP